MKKLQLFALLLSSAAFTLFSCGQDAAEITLQWDSDSNGALEVVNTSGKDIVLFIGDRPTDSGLMGGVRAQSTRFVDICKYVPDCGVGGWVIIKGITRDIYNENVDNLTGVTKIDFSAMATYKSGQRYRIVIDYNTIGDNAVRLVNRGRVGMELRKDSPQGEKVAFLPALQQNQLMYTQTTAGMTLFPFYVLYNSSTQTVTTLSASTMFESVQVSPRPASGQIMTYYFPNDATDAWAKIVGTLKSPVAYVKVTNNVIGQSGYFTVGQGNRLLSQSGYDDIAPGEQLTYEIEADDAVIDTTTNAIIGGGMPKALIGVFYGGLIRVPVLFYDSEGNALTDPPVLYNGYDYSVSISGSGTSEAGYKAVITRGNKRDLSGQLSTL